MKKHAPLKLKLKEMLKNNTPVNRIFAYAILLLISSCRSSKLSSIKFKKIVGTIPGYIKADLTVFTSDTLNQYASLPSFYYSDSSLLGTEHSLSLVDQNTLPLFLKVPSFIIQNGNAEYIYYAYPKCNLIVSKNKDGGIEIVDTKGTAIQNNELSFFQKLFLATGRISPVGLPSYLISDSVKTISDIGNLESKIDLSKRLKLNFLDSFTIHSPISPAFKNIAETIIRYDAIHDSLKIIYYYKPILQKENIYTEKVLNIVRHINQPTNIPTYLFDHICRAAMNLLQESFPTKRILQTEDELYRNMTTIKHYFKNDARDFLLTNQYQLSINKFSLDSCFLDDLLPFVQNEDYRLLIRSIASRNNNAGHPKIASQVISLKGAQIDLQDLLKKHKGKLIVLDFWASWCSPCREAMPITRQLSKKYSSKKFVILYISLDKQTTKWKAASLSEKIKAENSYKVINIDSFQTKNNILLDEIPRYILINNQGKIINKNAPSPSDQSFKKIINAELKD